MEKILPRYDCIDPEVEARVDSIMEKMTLAEKVGQLVQVHQHGYNDDLAMFEEKIKAGAIGSIFAISDVRKVNHYQRLAVEQSRLGIPLLVGNDVIHGFRTMFPIPLAESCSWDLDLVEKCARAAAEEAAANGTDWNFAPMVDLARDPRWGRIAEGAGEDAYLGGEIGAARTRGFQADDLTSGRRMVACAKHFAAYGGAEAGRDYNTVDISDRTLRDVYLPPFKASFEAGAGTSMSSFNEIGGVPSAANTYLLTNILREEWGWEGMMVSDYEAIREMIVHGVAADLKDAARLAILAGVDMDMMSFAYANHLAELVEEGTVPLEMVERSARRVLRLKVALGLFDKVYADEELADSTILREDIRELALEAAQDSMVLLKNEGNLLPLKPGAQKIAVIGPLADNRRTLLGTWAMFGQEDDAETILEGLGHYVEEALLKHVVGCSVKDQDANIQAAVDAANEADLVILVVGESDDMSGEAHCRTHLGLPGRQQELADAVAATGRHIITVLLSGRPMVVPRLSEQSNALLAAWHGGIRAGRAIADILFGEVAPSGRLTAAWPRAEGQIPIYYGQKNTGRPIGGEGAKQFDEPFKSSYLDEPNTPLFPFGFGLSYTHFEYSDLTVESPEVGQDDTLKVSAIIKNTGERKGAEVVQLYVRDLVGSVTRPVRELKGFRKIHLAAGDEQRVSFEIEVSDLAFTALDMTRKVEPGAFKVWIGPDSASGLEGDFQVV